MRKLAIANIFLALFFFGAAGLASLYGKGNRWYLEKPELQTVGRPHLAFFAWRDSGIKGRILFHFDRNISVQKGGMGLSEENYVYTAIRHNLVRKIFQVIPDPLWNEVEAALKRNNNAVYEKGVFRIPVEGVPVVVMRLKDVSRVDEKVLVNINAYFWGGAEVSRIADLLKRRVLRSDLITVAGDLSGENMQMLWSVNGKNRE